MIERALRPSLQLLRLSRPRLWVYNLVVLWIGAYLASADSVVAIAAVSCLFLFPVSFVLYAPNDLHDVASDLLNPRKSSDLARYVSLHGRLITTVTVISIVVALTVPLMLGYLVSLVGIAGILLFAITYSVPPFRLKTIPFVDSASNGFWIACNLLVGIGLGVSEFGELGSFWKPIVLIAIAATVLHIVTAVMDYDSDLQAGDRTMPVVFGRYRAMYVAAMYTFIGAAIAADSIVTAYLILCGIVMIAYALFKQTWIRFIVYGFAYGGMLSLALSFTIG